MTLILDLPIQESLSRLDKKDKHENEKKQKIAREIYLFLGKNEKETKILNVNKKEPKEVLEMALKKIKNKNIL